MDLGSGVHVSSVNTDQWEPDPDIGGLMHVVCQVDHTEVGMSRFDEDPRHPLEYTLPERETVYVIEGEVRVEMKGGPTVSLKPGDIASFPKGAVTTWHIVKAPYREVWVFA